MVSPKTRNTGKIWTCYNTCPQHNFSQLHEPRARCSLSGCLTRSRLSSKFRCVCTSVSSGVRLSEVSTTMLSDGRGDGICKELERGARCRRSEEEELQARCHLTHSRRRSNFRELRTSSLGLSVRECLRHVFFLIPQDKNMPRSKHKG